MESHTCSILHVLPTNLPSVDFSQMIPTRSFPLMPLKSYPPGGKGLLRIPRKQDER